METAVMSGWEDHLNKGRAYLRTARNGRRRSAVFNGQLVFQLAALGIEHIMAGICQYHRRMPTDHTLSGLVAALAEVAPLDNDLARRICRLEIMEDLCALSAAPKPPPRDEQVALILDTAAALTRFAGQQIPPQA